MPARKKQRPVLREKEKPSANDNMQRLAPPAAKLKAGTQLPRTCALAELLDVHGAVYSFKDPLYQLGHQIGLLRPIRCRCGAWVLIEVERVAR